MDKTAGFESRPVTVLSHMKDKPQVIQFPGCQLELPGMYKYLYMYVALEV